MARANKAALLATSTVRAFGGAPPPTMPSADFCVAVRSPCDDLSLVAETQRRPPEVRTTAFAARSPDLPPRSLMTLDFAIICSLVRPGRPRYPVLVHRAAALLHASFRPHLAATPLRFAHMRALVSSVPREGIFLPFANDGLLVMPGGARSSPAAAKRCAAGA